MNRGDEVESRRHAVRLPLLCTLDTTSWRYAEMAKTRAAFLLEHDATPTALSAGKFRAVLYTIDTSAVAVSDSCFANTYYHLISASSAGNIHHRSKVQPRNPRSPHVTSEARSSPSNISSATNHIASAIPPPSRPRYPISQSTHERGKDIENKMPPKRQQIGGTGVGRPVQSQRGGYARQVFAEITSPENRSVVTAVGFFTVCMPICIRGSEGGWCRGGSGVGRMRNWETGTWESPGRWVRIDKSMIFPAVAGRKGVVRRRGQRRWDGG
jgi:hypothetical protein